MKSEGYHLYGLSNWCTKCHETMAQYPIFQLLEGQVISSEEKIVKPDLAIYERFCQKYSLLPEECLFADDRMENVEAARKLGMQAICFENAVQYEQELRKILASVV